MDTTNPTGLTYINLASGQSDSGSAAEPSQLPVPTSPPFSPWSPVRSPPYSPPWSPWLVRSPTNLRSGDDIYPDESVSNAPSPEHQTSSEASSEPSLKVSATTGVFRWAWETIRGTDEAEEDDEDDGDTTTIVPNRPSGIKSPSHESQVTEISHFSFTNLPSDDPHRRISASEVRSQAIAIPTTVVHRSQGFPHHFSNYDGLPLTNRHPLIEHPLTPDGAYISGSPPGPARIVTNRWDRSDPEAMYHDPTKPPRGPSRKSPFSKAEYRGKDRMTPTGLEQGFGNLDIQR